MKLFLAAVIFAASASSAIAGNTYIVTKVGMWQIKVTDGMPSVLKVTEFNEDDHVIFAVDSIGGPTPPPDGITGKVAEVSKRVLANAKEAEGLMIIVKTIRDLKPNPTDAKAIFGIAVSALKVKITPAEAARVEAWATEINGLGEFDAVTLDGIVKGLASAFDLSSTAQVTEEGLADWLPLILTIIELIIQLLAKGP